MALTPNQELEGLEAQIISLDNAVLANKEEAPRYSEHYRELVEAIISLREMYRKQNDFDREMQMYDIQQRLFTEYGDERELVPWEMYKGGCCYHYGKKGDAIRYLEGAFRMSEDALKKYRWFIYSDETELRSTWSLHASPSHGKALCRLYIEANRHADALLVAPSCYSYVRNRILDHTPVGEAFEIALNTWMLWTEICGNIYSECNQKYMSRHMYKVTIEDLKRFNWDSPMTRLPKSRHKFFSEIHKRKLERLGPDSDDEADSDEEPEAYVPIERRLKLAYLESATLLTARIKCTTLVVDIDKAPPYKALSHAWDSTRKVISYTRDDGPPYADNGDEGDSNFPRETITVDGQDVLIGKSLFCALQQIRHPDSVIPIWVDALCTTHVELKKRAEWALAIKDIYKCAAEVIIWLGQGDKQTEKAIEFVDKFWDERPQRYSELGEYLFGPQAIVPWQEIETFFRLPWWSRIWTIQEFLVAKHLSIRCGSRTISWRNLLEFTTFVDLAPLPNRLADDRKAILQHQIALVRGKHRCLELRDEYRMRAGISLETLWQATKTHESYDPRDKI